MSEPYQPQKISRLPNGSYTWRCPTSVEYVRMQLMLGFKICIAVDLVILAVGIALLLYTRSMELLMIFGAIAGGFLALVLLIFGLSVLIYRDPWERYQLMDTYIMTGYGRSSSWFNYKNTKVLNIRPTYLELRGKVAVMRVYVPAEDYPFVRDFIKYRMPDEAEINYL